MLLGSVQGQQGTSIGTWLTRPGKVLDPVGQAGWHRSLFYLSGEWLPEEEEKLVATMKELHGDTVVDDMAMCSSVTWDEVASHVGSRNGIQCRAKWLFTWPDQPNKPKWERRWGHSENLRLLQCLREQEQVEDEDEVDWTALASNWASIRSPYYLRNKWSCLRRHVPNHTLNSYTGEWKGTYGVELPFFA